MLDKPPPLDILAPLWVWVIGILAGAVAYLEEFKLEDPWRVWILKAMTKGTSAALAAKLSYHAFVAMGAKDDWLLVMVGIGAHMGTETLRFLGNLYKSKVQ